MAKNSDIGNKSYEYNENEQNGINAVLLELNDNKIVIAFPIREKAAGKRWGVLIFTARQLTQGLGSDHAVLAVMQGAFESEESFLNRVEAHGIDRAELVERTTKK